MLSSITPFLFRWVLSVVDRMRHLSKMKKNYIWFFKNTLAYLIIIFKAKYIPFRDDEVKQTVSEIA